MRRRRRALLQGGVGGFCCIKSGFSRKGTFKESGVEEQEEEEKRQIRRRGVGAEHQTAKRKKWEEQMCVTEPTGGTQTGRWRAKVSDVSFNLKTTQQKIVGTLVLMCLQYERSQQAREYLKRPKVHSKVRDSP